MTPCLAHRDTLLGPDWYLLIDSDEQIEPERFRDWFVNCGIPETHDVIELACFNYGMTQLDQHVTQDHAGLLIRAAAVSQFLVLNKEDRYFYKDPVVFPQRWRTSLLTVHHSDHLPMVHHFSYARSTRQLLKTKLLTSGHSSDREHDPGNTKSLSPEAYAQLVSLDPEQLRLQDVDSEVVRRLRVPVFHK